MSHGDFKCPEMSEQDRRRNMERDAAPKLADALEALVDCYGRPVGTREEEQILTRCQEVLRKAGRGP